VGRWLVLFASACGRLAFDPIAGAPADSTGSESTTPGCTGERFAPEVILPEFATGLTEYDPSEHADRREIFLVYDGGVASFDLHVATRASAAQPYGTPVPLALNTTFRDADPSTTDDGLLLTFTSERTGAPRAFQSTRASTGDSFVAATAIPGLETVDAFSQDLSPDGLTIYLGSTTALQQATRADRASAFGPPMVVSATGVEFPAISADGLEVISHKQIGNYRLYRQTRSSITQPFGPPVELAVPATGEGVDPDLSVDGRRLMFVAGGVLVVSDRICD
jgi:hypothetical protein